MSWADAYRLAGIPNPEEFVKSGRKPGKRRNCDQTIDWEAIENAYVWGEAIQQRQDGTWIRQFPSFKDLERKFGVSHSGIHYASKKYNWNERREGFALKSKTAFDEALASSRALAAKDVVSVLDTYILKFKKNLQDGKTRADSMTDLNTAVRLRQFMMGEVESRKEEKHTLSLDEMQSRHRAARERMLDVSDASAGELVGADALPPDAAEGEVIDVPASTGEVDE